jgi:hypothetical protein
MLLKRVEQLRPKARFGGQQMKLIDGNFKRAASFFKPGLEALSYTALATLQSFPSPP